MARRGQRNRFPRGVPLVGWLLVAIPLLVGLAFLADVIRRCGVGIPLGHPLAWVLLFTGGLFLYDQTTLGRQRMWRRRRLPLFARLRFGARRGASICALCHDALGGDVEPEACPDCATVYHPECRAELDRCGTLGCRRSVSGKVAARLKRG